MDFHQNTVPETDNNNQNNVNYTTDTNDGTQYNQPVEDTVQNTNGVSEQAQMPYVNSSQSPYQPQQTYGNDIQSSYQVQQPYGNEGRYPYQNNQNNSAPNYHNGNPYANNNGNPYYGSTAQGTNTGYNNNSYGNSGYNYNNNGYNPNYGRYAYPVNVSEPGSKLATAAMVLGIISIISCFTFTIYPAFITGGIAIVLALLSKGRRPKLLNNARIGIICAVIGLVSNTMLITGVTVLYFTNDDFRARVNQNYEEQYGQTIDEMLKEILEDSGYSY
ncbi:MAG: DUF4190 domain-containing protein [Lachnospiraceae bacterium]|nr:DUF4190 domain-containing protein [Lachnospiraceae bacterium]